MTDNLIKKEIEEFRKEFCYIEDGAYELDWDLGIKPNGKDRLPELINFFRSSLHKIKDEAKREVIEKIEKLKGTAEHHEWEQMKRQSWGYDKAIDDILNSLKEDGGEENEKTKNVL